MVIKISLGKKNEKDTFLGRFKVDLPNGDQVFLMTQGDPLVCETREDKQFVLY
ncbi:hypothetical protein LCGC14_1076050 [marine sediment metagenome]|uniref:Uncharacterized protein n=1 Tax=marine sediment metagenome TaxID=412755 RepID=A0A0F9MGM1_9ZZZZ